MIWHMLFCWPRRWKADAARQLVDRRGDRVGEVVMLTCQRCGWIVRRNL